MKLKITRASNGVILEYLSDHEDKRNSMHDTVVIDFDNSEKKLCTN